MNIDREQLSTTPPSEEPLPQRQHRQRASRQEHEGHLRHSLLVGELLLPGHHRRPPQELVIGHSMRHIARLEKRLHAHTVHGLLARLHDRGGGGGAIGVELGVRDNVVAVDVRRGGEADHHASDENH